jgi:hypothetical protein
MDDLTEAEWNELGSRLGYVQPSVVAQGLQDYDSFSRGELPQNVQDAFYEAAKVVDTFPSNPDCTHENAHPVGEQCVEGETQTVMRCCDCRRGDWLV